MYVCVSVYVCVLCSMLPVQLLRVVDEKENDSGDAEMGGDSHDWQVSAISALLSSTSASTAIASCRPSV